MHAEFFNTCLTGSCFSDCWKNSSSQSTADLYSVVSDGIARSFYGSGATWAVELDICTIFDRVWHSGILYKPIMEFHVRHSALFHFFQVKDGFRCFWMGNLRKNIQLMLEFKAPFLVLCFSYYILLTSNDIFNIAIYADDTNLTRHQQQPQLAYELESDLQDTVNWTGRDMFISMLEKLSLFRLAGQITLMLLMWKWVGLFLRKIIF